MEIRKARLNKIEEESLKIVTQNQLAVKIGKDADYISKLERGKRTPSLRTLQEICNELGVKMNYLFFIIGI